MTRDSIHLIAHCLLNPHTRLKGLQPPAFEPEGAVVQLPCPEALLLGLDRWAVTFEQLDHPIFRRLAQELIRPVADLAEMFSDNGHRVVVVGVAKSPSCGIFTTTFGFEGGLPRTAEHRHVAGPGVFMEELAQELAERRIEVEWMEVG
ncbi:MAG: hypothetical protein JW986_05200 [Methanotrichaceae archaeon]|nr:hypothetical protein [Methanotrichaceae archaeon]